MNKSTSHQPKPFRGVMISSTYTDLKKHREELRDAINGHGLHPVVMEHDAAKVDDVIESSIEMVRECEAYILLVSRKYGQIPIDPRNPKKISITEMEFDEAQ